MSNEEEGPVSKKLRCSEPDLCVIVGQDEEKKEYRYHYQVLASHSNYIDAMFATPMKESQSMEVKFPDLTPDVWESMMGFLTDPVKARGMNFADAMKVAAGYNQYDFPAGRELCDQVFCEVFNEKNRRYVEDSDDDLDSLIDAYILADQAHLEKAKLIGTRYFRYALRCIGRSGRSRFTEHHIEKLVPLIAREDLLRGEYKEEDIVQPLFAKYLVAKFMNYQCNYDLGQAVPKLHLSGTKSNADGEFIRNIHNVCFTCYRPIHFYDGIIFRRVNMSMLEDDWVIYGETEEGETTVLWKNPGSKNLPLPPQSGWEPVHELAGGNPKIEYLYRKSD